MRGIILSCVAAGTLAASVAFAEPEEDMARQAAMAERFDPFDAATAKDWSPAFPFPFFRSVSEGDPDEVSLLLKPGTYTVVVLCNCEKIGVALKPPAGPDVTPDRVNDQGAMYSVTVAAAGEFKVAADMQDCAEASCGYAVKAYLKN